MLAKQNTMDFPSQNVDFILTPLSYSRHRRGVEPLVTVIYRRVLLAIVSSDAIPL